MKRRKGAQHVALSPAERSATTKIGTSAMSIWLAAVWRRSKRRTRAMPARALRSCQACDGRAELQCDMAPSAKVKGLCTNPTPTMAARSMRDPHGWRASLWCPGSALVVGWVGATPTMAPTGIEFDDYPSDASPVMVVLDSDHFSVLKELDLYTTSHGRFLIPSGARVRQRPRAHY
jgi:hypothetical protein